MSGTYSEYDYDLRAVDQDNEAERFGPSSEDKPEDWLVRARRSRGLCGLCAQKLTEPWLDAANIRCSCGASNRVVPHETEAQ